MNVCLAATARSTPASHPEYLLTMLVPSSNQTLVRSSSHFLFQFYSLWSTIAYTANKQWNKILFKNLKSHAAKELPTLCGTRVLNTALAGSSYDSFQPYTSFYLMTNLTHNYFVYMYVYFNSLHVSSIQVLIIRRFNCINTISGMSLYVGDRLVRRFGRSVQTCVPDSDLHRVTYTRYRIDTIESPDDEHLNARNM